MMKSPIEHPLRNRDRLSIMAGILEVALNGSLKTQILYKTNLSFAQSIKYLALLLDLKLLEVVENSERKVFKTTNKGMRFVQSHRETREFLKKETHATLKESKISKP